MFWQLYLGAKLALDIDEPELNYSNDIEAGNETGHVGNVTRYFMFRRSPAPAEHI